MGQLVKKLRSYLKIKLSRGDICVANVVPRANGAHLGKQFVLKMTKNTDIL